MKNNFKIMKSKADLNEPLKSLGAFSNPKIWAQEMGFYNPAWVVSFYAASRERTESKGSDPSVHLNIHYKSSNRTFMSYDDRDSNDTSDTPESSTFSFLNYEILKPRRLTCEPSVMITLNNAVRNKNESYDYNSSDEHEAANVKRKRPGTGTGIGTGIGTATGTGPCDTLRNRNTICVGDMGSAGSLMSHSTRSVCSASSMKSSMSRKNTPSVASWQRCYNDKGEYDEVETLYRLEGRRKTYSTLEERPPFHPGISQGIPELYGVRKSFSKVGTKIHGSDSPQLRRQHSDASVTPERGLERGSSLHRSVPLLSYDESEIDDRVGNGMPMEMNDGINEEADDEADEDEEKEKKEERAARKVSDSRVLMIDGAEVLVEWRHSVAQSTVPRWIIAEEQVATATVAVAAIIVVTVASPSLRHTGAS